MRRGPTAGAVIAGVGFAGGGDGGAAQTAWQRVMAPGDIAQGAAQAQAAIRLEGGAAEGVKVKNGLAQGKEAFLLAVFFGQGKKLAGFTGHAAGHWPIS